MHNLFIYETPHPSHRAFAESINCRIPSGSTISKPSFVDHFKTMEWYRTVSRMAPLVRYTIERTAKDYKPPKNPPDIVLLEGWRQMAIARKFPDSFKVLIGGDWFPYAFRKNKRMQSYYDEMDMIVSVSGLHKKYLPPSVQHKTKIIHPPVMMKAEGMANGVDCLFIGNVYERVKRVDRSIRIFREAFPGGRRFNIIGAHGRRRNRRLDNVIYWGRIDNTKEMFHNILMDSMFYIHWGEFDPHPMTTVEAMVHGIIPIVSPMTGTHYLTEQIVGECDTEDDAVRIMKDLSSDDVRHLREQCVKVTRHYTVDRAKEMFRFAVMSGYRKHRK